MKRFLLLFSGSAALLAALVILSSWLTLKDLPSVTQLEKCFKGTMFGVEVCPSSSTYTKISSVSPRFIEALIVSEDASFYHHGGIDWFEVKESFKANLSAKGFKRGASTISQQLIKNAFLTPDKSISRKLKEFYLTLQMESTFSKEFILEKYLNIVEFGPDLFGISEASRFYFSKAPDELNTLESAYLVHLLPSPNKYSETFQQGELTEFSRKMVLLICKRLHFYKKISDEEYEYVQENVDRFPWYWAPFDD